MKLQRIALNDMERIVIDQKKSLMPIPWRKTCCVATFTVNGMAMNRFGEVIDLVGGRRDIKHKTLRTIGNAQQRFEEDALRLFRACRFVAKLDFLPTEDY